jgi:exonuclease SbcC
MITRLELENFRRHNHLVVNFTEGFNYISGKNYSGKTTIVYAILLAFYGSKILPGTVKRLSTRGQKKSFKVTLDFQADKKYRIIRKENNASLYKEEVLIANTVSEVNKAVEDIIGMDANTFKMMRVSTQGESAAILSLGVTGLHKFIEMVSKVSVISNVISKANTKQQVSEGILGRLSPAEDLKLLDKEINDLKDSLNDSHASIKKSHDSIDTIGSNINKINEELLEYKLQYKKQENYRIKLASIISLIQNSTKNLEKYKSENSLELYDLSPLEKKIVEIQKVQESLLSKQYEYETVKKEIEITHKSIREWGRVLDKCKKEDIHLTDEDLQTYDHAKNEVHILYERAQNKKETLETLKSSLEDAICPTCKRPFEGHDAEEIKKHLEIAQKEYEYARDSYKQTYKLYETLGPKISRYEEVQKQEEEAVKNISASNETLAELKNEEKSLLSDRERKAKIDLEVEELLSEYSEKQQYNFRQEHISKDISNLEEEIGRLQKEKEILESQNVSEKVTSSDVEYIEKKLSESNSLLSDWQAYLAKEKITYSNTYNEYSRKNEKMERLLKQEEERKEEEKNIILCKKLAKYLRDNRDRFMQTVWGSITAYASSFASDCTNSAISKIRRTVEGNFEYKEEEHWCPITDASGAQKAIIGLGLRLSFSSAVPTPMSTILLDEVTADFDEEHALAVSLVLSNQFKQIISISHRNIDASCANNLIAIGDKI